MRLTLFSTVVLLVACGGPTGQVSLTPLASDSTAALLTTTTASPKGTSLKRVRILINEAELRGGGAGRVSMCNHRGGHTEQGPFVLDLSAAALANGKVAEPLLLTDVPVGQYRGTELEIEPLTEREHHRQAPAVGPSFEDFNDGSTAIIDGIWQGEAFTFRTSFEAEQEGNSPVTVSADRAVALTMTIDAAAWFTGQDGTALDPRDQANREALTAGIRASMTIDPDSGRDQHH